MTFNTFTKNKSVCQYLLIKESFDKILVRLSEQIGWLSLTTELLCKVDSLYNFENPDEVILCGLRSILDETLLNYRGLYNQIDKLCTNLSDNK